MTVGVTGGRSITWRTTSPTTGASARSAPQLLQAIGSCPRRTSGSRRFKFAPGDPGCLPWARFASLASARRSARFLRVPIGSLDGGADEVVESLLASASR